MNRNPRALLAAAASFGLFTAGAVARADPKQECPDAYEATQSLRDRGRLLDAWKQAIACSAPTCSAYVTKDCIQWLAEIEALVPTVVFTAKDSAGADAPAVRVSVDGQRVASKLDGKAVSLDPGEHVVRFETDGAEPVEQKVAIRAGEKNRKLSASFKKPPPAAPSGPRPLPLPLPEPDTVPPRTGVPIWAWISGGVGVVALGVSAGFGVSALRAQSKLVAACGGDPARCPSRLDAETVPLAGRRDRDRSVFFGLSAAGVIGIGVGVVGIAITPSKVSSDGTSFVLAPFGSPLGGGVEMQGQF